MRVKLKEVDLRMESMKKFRRVLAQHLKECEYELQEHGEAACCPVVRGTKRS